MEGVGTKESVLIEILLTRPNTDIKEIVVCYQKNYGRSLEKDIMDETSGHFKRLLVSACQGNRTELSPEQLQKAATQGVESVIDRNLAREDAQKLYQAGAKKIGTDESAFLQVMAVRHYYQLRATFEEYHRLAGKDILSAVKGEMSGDLEDGFKALVKCAKNRPQYFAERLHKAMAGFGTKDSTLIRVIVSRSEIDLQDIKDEYRNMYQKSLHDAVSSETSGDYKKLLLGITGP
ncbi:annexin A7/11 [Mytilus galloprovincialis]|uniref:Annexin n=1 Tax=Mytilus galloprovincialis TaxID=29158 RepID=A0A8B6HKX6_MYTGA|nr:annexin A7/11 [Mytilus galloprovincialis]